MKWFKHSARASNDSKIAELEDNFGLEGYAVYFKILEIVCQEMEDTDNTKVCYSARKWKRILGVSVQKLTKILEFSDSFSLLFANFSKKSGQLFITVDVPNILKYRDEYTRKRDKVSGECPDNVAQEKEKDKDKEKYNPPSQTVLLHDGISDDYRKITKVEDNKSRQRAGGKEVIFDFNKLKKGKI